MRVRIRGPGGQATISLAKTATVGDLCSQIAEQTSIASFDVKYGYPPKPLLLDAYEQSKKLAEIGLKLDGEQLIISEKMEPLNKHAAPSTEGSKSQGAYSQPSLPNDTSTSSKTTAASSFAFDNVGAKPPPLSQQSDKPVPPTNKPSSPSHEAPEMPVPTHASTMVLRVMPDDNSCLFRAFNFAFLGGMDNMHELRSVIAQTIQANRDKYTTVVLDKEPDKYCRWIQTQDAWGGGIELGILSEHFSIEICAIDVQTLNIVRFNEGMPQRCILVYSGIHYDTIALSQSDPPYTNAYNDPEFDTKIFDAADDVVLEKAVELCRILQGRHYFTDTAGGTFRCTICGMACLGEKAVNEHGMETGHINFEQAA